MLCLALTLSVGAAGQRRGPIAPAASRANGEASRPADLFSILENGATSAERRAAVRDLLMEHGVAIAPRLCEVLSGGSPAARLAVARAIAETPQRADSIYSAPLLGMLDTDDELRLAVVAALSTIRDDSLVDRLGGVVEDSGRTERSRIAAIEVLGARTQRSAIEILISALADPTSPLCGPALAALERSTGQEFGGDSAAALTWWRASSDVALPAWQQLQIDRLVRQTSTDRQRVRVLEGRVTGILRDTFVRADETARAGLLIGYLTDETDVVRLLGLELVLSRLTEAKVVRPDAIAECRRLLDAAEPIVRAAAARTLAGLRDADDEPRLTGRLKIENQSAVRQALVYGLGYVGGAGTLPTLLHALAESDEPTRDEAVTAIGRLAERGLVEGAERERVVTALAERATAIRRSSASRERLVRAMSRMPDPRFADFLVSCLSAAETPATRLAAIRGIQFLIGSPTGDEAGGIGTASQQALRTETLIDALLPLCGGGPPAVRRAAIEAVGAIGGGLGSLAALWTAALDTREADETLRAAAWTALAQVVARTPSGELLTWALRIGDDTVAPPVRRIELMRMIEERLIAAEVSATQRGLVRLKLGAACVSAVRFEEAAQAYRGAMADLRSVDVRLVTDAAEGYLVACLLAGRYGEASADALFEVAGDVDMARVLDRGLAELADCIEPESAERTCAVLAQLAAYPPGEWSAEHARRLGALRERAQAIRDTREEARLAAAAEAMRRGDDAAARGFLAELGSRAVPALQRMLLKAMSDSATSELEGDLVGLLKIALPGWPGYSPQAPLPQRILAVEAAGAM